MYDLNEETENRKRNWHEHILIMDENTLPKISHFSITNWKDIGE
jgi:hypothetical protein